jgi:preprotein translocase subunit SecG
MESTLLIVQIVLAVLIVLIVLIQKSTSAGFGSYSGSNESFFGASGPSGFLTKATFILGAIFVLNTLYLGYLYNSSNTKSVVDSVIQNGDIPQAPKNSNQQSSTPFQNSAPQAPSIPNNN